MAIGAGLGLLFGMMLLDSAITGPLAGVGIGAVIGVIWEAQNRQGRTD
jgi:hypothetical protein